MDTASQKALSASTSFRFKGGRKSPLGFLPASTQDSDKTILEKLLVGMGFGVKK